MSDYNTILNTWPRNKKISENVFKLTIQVDEFSGIANSSATEVRPMLKKGDAFRLLTTDRQPDA